MREKFDAVILIGIVGGGNDDANVKVIVANEAGDAWSREDSGERDRCAPMGKAGGDDGSDVGAGFAGIRADQGVGRSVVAVKKFGNGTAKGKEGGIVERGNSRDAANAVCSKELSGHS